jgi:hypothetical protein
MRQVVPGVWQVVSTAPQPQVSRPGTLQIPPTEPMLGLTEAGQPSTQVEPDPQALPGAQLASEPSDPSEPFRSVPASATGRQLQLPGTGSYPAAQSRKHMLLDDLQPTPARTADAAAMPMSPARMPVARCKGCSACMPRATVFSPQTVSVF